MQNTPPRGCRSLCTSPSVAIAAPCAGAAAAAWKPELEPIILVVSRKALAAALCPSVLLYPLHKPMLRVVPEGAWAAENCVWSGLSKATCLKELEALLILLVLLLGLGTDTAPLPRFLVPFSPSSRCSNLFVSGEFLTRLHLQNRCFLIFPPSVVLNYRNLASRKNAKIFL